jgi:Alkyl sulfatase C-terminal
MPRNILRATAAETRICGELSNGANPPRTTREEAADLRVTLTKGDLLQLIGPGSADGLTTDGDASVLTKLVPPTDQPEPDLPIVTPRAAASATGLPVAKSGDGNAVGWVKDTEETRGGRRRLPNSRVARGPGTAPRTVNPSSVGVSRSSISTKRQSILLTSPVASVEASALSSPLADKGSPGQCAPRVST